MTKIPDEIIAEFALRSKTAEAEHERRVTTAEKDNPKLADIRKKRSMIAYEAASSLRGKSDDEREAQLQSIQSELDLLSEIECEELVRMGLPKDYLERKYICPKCKDTGFFGNPVKQPCECIKQRVLQLNYASSNLENGEYFETFDVNIFTDERQKKQMQNVCEYAEEYADSIPNTTKPNLILIGETGMGKSFTLNCIAHRVLNRDMSVVKITAYNFINSIMNNIRYSEPLPNFSGCDLLLIDDLGSEPMLNNITRESIFNVINERESANKPLVVATNLSVENLMEIYGERIFSRLISKKLSKVFKLVGDDVRIRQ